MNITKNKQTHRYREQTRGYQWVEGRWENTVLVELEVPTTGCKRGSKMYYTTWGI